MDKRGGELQRYESQEAFGGPHRSSHNERRGPPLESAAPLLTEIISKQIVPRLLLAHRFDAPEPAPAREPAVASERDIAELADLAVMLETSEALQRVEALMSSGATYEAGLLDLVGGAARLLGNQWLEDERSFAEVTLGLATLHRVVALMRHVLKPPLASRGLHVLTSAPGEQHTLAIQVLGDLLVQAGWDAEVRPNLAEEELIAKVASEPVAMVGVSISSAAFVEPIAVLVARVRAASLNRDITVMLGGALDLSTHAKEIGAVFCADARSALTWVDRHARITL
ncbi:MAG: cobalamin B12-binding domain-containing protein [Deltaproteobacteria bacterium]|nr:cobalamin B12-binding domain-containing protein [Nannocystaceae bacterium]